MTKESCLKKGLVMAGIIAAVLSLAGCPKEAGGNGGENNFSITSIEGTWLWKHNNENIDTKVTITESTFISEDVGSNSSTYYYLDFTGSIVKVVNKDSIVGIIAKCNQSTATYDKDKYKLFYIKNINGKTSFDLGTYQEFLVQHDSIADAEDEFSQITSSSTYLNTVGFQTYLFQ